MKSYDLDTQRKQFVDIVDHHMEHLQSTQGVGRCWCRFDLILSWAQQGLKAKGDKAPGPGKVHVGHATSHLRKKI